MTERFGRYELVRVLGRGGVGEVWEAWLHGPLGFRKPVALKLLRDAPREAAKELAQEARLGALVSHPNVVSTHELGEVDGRWFIAMELVQGGTVADLVERGPLSPRAAVEVAMQVAAGLEHIHGLAIDGRPAGLVHRDIKPANLLLTDQGLVKIADLGIARLAGTGRGGMGTYGFMPGEQLDGHEDARADIFALGVTLHRMLTGGPMFGTGVPALYAAAHADEHVERTGAIEEVRALHPDLADIVARCVRRDRDERWPDAASLAQALAALQGPDLVGPSLSATLGPPLEAAPTVPTHTGRSRGRVPAPADPFVGREADLDALLQRLHTAPLVTLTGPAGVGKTRLATEAARRLQRAWPGGAWFADASEARTGNGVCAAVGRALGVPLGGDDPGAALVAPLSELGRALLVVDDVERVADATAELVARWLQEAPELGVLVTSQVPLRLPDEQRMTLGPLPLADAVALFRERSGAQAPDAELRALVAQLDGLPLAIELAAARARVRGVPAVADGLADRLALLQPEEDGWPTRHRSLRASLEATWALLPPWGPACMAQLAAFVDGFTLEAADAVLDLSAWPDAPWVMDCLAQLADLSLVAVDARSGRFRVLQGVAEHARLACPDEAAHAERRHGAWFAQLGTPFALVAVTQRRGVELKARLEADLDNVVHAARAALRRGDGEIATACALAARRVLEIRGPVAASDALLSDVEPISGSRRSEVQTTRSWLNLLLGRLDLAASLAVAARERARRDGDRRQEGLAEMYLGLLAYMQGDARDAVDILRRAVLLFDRLGDRYLQAVALQNLGVAYDGDVEGALEIHGATAVLAEALGDDRLACMALANTGHTRHMAGAPDPDAPLQRALAIALAEKSLRQEGIVRAYLGSRLRDRERLDEARVEILRACELLRDVGELRMLGFATCLLGQVELEAGDPAAALARIDEGLAMVEGMATGRHFLVQRAQALYALDRVEEAHRVLTRAIVWLRKRQDDRYLAQALAIRACWTRSPEDLAEAEQRLGALGAEAAVRRSIEQARRVLAGD